MCTLRAHLVENEAKRPVDTVNPRGNDHPWHNSQVSIAKRIRKQFFVWLGL